MTKIHDQQLIADLMQYLAVGNYVPTACAAVGISTGTFYTWLKVGRDTEERIAAEDNAEDLRVGLLKGEEVLDLTEWECRCWLVRSMYLVASARSEAYALATVRQAMPTQWIAAMTFLERRFPHRWRRRRSVDAEAAESEPVAGIDEAMLLADPEASQLIHQALTIVASKDIRRELARPIKRELPDAA